MTLYGNKLNRGKKLKVGKNKPHQCIEYKTQQNKYLLRYRATKTHDIKMDKTFETT